MKKLKSTIIYQENLAKKFSKTEYYKTQDKNMKTWQHILNEKRKLSTPRLEFITNLIDYYKNKSKDYTSSTGKILYGIYEKNKKAITHGNQIKNTNLTEIIAKPETLLLAYKTIKGNKGAMTQGSVKSTEDIKTMTPEQRELYYNSLEFPDKFSMADILLTSKLIKKGIYPWGSSTRIYVPKPGVKDKQRPITIPPFMDRIVQKAITLVLEAIYEPYFESLNTSFGFRPNKGVHDAIAALTTQYTNGMKTAVEGDIEAAYDTVDRQILIKILSEKIIDKKFLNLIKERLNYEYVENIEGKTIRTRPTLGIPQGGIDSPYLLNIYMNKFDEFIHNDVNEIFNKMNGKYKDIPTRNKESIKIKNQIRGEKRKMRWIKEKIHKETNKEKIEEFKEELYKYIKIIRKLWHQARNRTTSVPNKRRLRVFYIRYADDWILLTNGTIEIANFLKKKTSEFLKNELKLTLSDKKTVVTKISKSPAKFLGFELKVSPRGPLQKKPTNNNRFQKYKLTRRPGGLNIWTKPDRQRLINRLHMKGFCNENGNPKEIPWLSCLESQTIIQRYNSILLGLANYYLGYVRNRATIHRWIYIIRFSCFKTLAQKYRTSIGRIFKKYGYRMHSKSLQTVKFIVRIKLDSETYEKSYFLYSYRDLIRMNKNSKKEKQQRFYDTKKNTIIGEYPYLGNKLPAITNDDYLEKISWVSLRTQALMDLPCSYCGTFDNVHQHHIQHIRKRAYTLIDENTPYKKIMALRNRKQIPICKNCHLKFIHPGKYSGPKLINITPIKTIDNRILHIESFVKPGQEYQSQSLTEKGWKLVQKRLPKKRMT